MVIGSYSSTWSKFRSMQLMICMQTPGRHMFCKIVTCNGKTEITESVQIVLDPVFDVESDGVVRF